MKYAGGSENDCTTGALQVVIDKYDDGYAYACWAQVG